MLGFEDFESHAEDLAPIAIFWKDGTPIGGILGPALNPEQWAQQMQAQEAEEARREELRNLAENVLLLDDYRKRTDDPRETL